MCVCVRVLELCAIVFVLTRCFSVFVCMFDLVFVATSPVLIR